MRIYVSEDFSFSTCSDILNANNSNVSIYSVWNISFIRKGVKTSVRWLGLPIQIPWFYRINGQFVFTDQAICASDRKQMMASIIASYARAESNEVDG